MRNGDRLDLLPGAGVQEKVLFGKTTITFTYNHNFAGFPEIRFAKNGREDGVFGVLRLDVGIG